MEKEFVSYELALRMKALGFDELCFGYYENGVFIVHYNSKQEYELLLNCTTPTFSQAFRWFREKCELTWEHSFDDSQIQLYVGEIAYPDNYLDFFKSIEVKYDCYNKAFEEAELACLNKLIEIVETKLE